MLKLLRKRNMFLLWFAQVISVSGDWVLFVSLPFYVFSLTGSTLATGAMFIASTLPRILLGSVAGVFVDRWDRKWTMILADLSRAVLLLALLAVHDAGQVWIIYIVAFVQAAIAQFFVPAENALLPHLVDPTDLLAANSLNTLGQSIARLVAPALGGALLAWFGLSSTVLSDSVSFLVSAGLLALIALPPQPAGMARPARGNAAGWMSFGREWLDGLDVVRGNQTVSTVFVVFGVLMIGEGILDVMLAPFVKERLQGDALLLGWMMSAQAAGSLAGGGAVGTLAKRAPALSLIAFGALGWGVFDFMIFNSTLVPFILILFVIVGVPLVALTVSINALLQRDVPHEFHGRVFGALATIGALATLAGMGLSSLLGDWLGIRPMLNVACCLFVLSGLALYARLRAKAS